MHGLWQDVVMQKSKAASTEFADIGCSVVEVSTTDEATPAWRNTAASGWRHTRSQAGDGHRGCRADSGP